MSDVEVEGSNAEEEDGEFPDLQFAEWPQSFPHPLETGFLSVVVGNSSLQWAYHTCYQADEEEKDFNPALFWRVPVSFIEEKAKITDYFPGESASLFFGGDGVDSVDEVVQYMVLKKRIPAVTVYVISSNKEHEAKLQTLLKGLPVRFHKLTVTDFYSAEDLPYPDIGVDRVAAAKAIKAFPSLIIDGGTALTHTAIDVDGKIVGGGIAPGLHSEFRALSEYCHDLPEIPPTATKALLDNIREGTAEPIPLFATNTKDACIGAVLKSTALFVNSVARSWMQKYLSDQETAQETEEDAQGVKKATGAIATVVNKLKEITYQTRKDDQAHKPGVIVTGADGALLYAMLTPAVKQLVEWDEPVVFEDTNNSPIEHDSFLHHRGIQTLLLDKKAREWGKATAQKLQEEDYESDTNRRLYFVGQRVAKEFEDNPDPETGETVFRGVVVRGIYGDTFDDDLFVVVYDDGDSEEYDTINLYDGLQLYSEVCEVKGVPEEYKDDIEQKRKASSEAAVKLVDWSEQVRRMVDQRTLAAQKKEERAAKRKAAAPKRALPSTKSTSSKRLKGEAPAKTPPKTTTTTSVTPPRSSKRTESIRNSAAKEVERSESPAPESEPRTRATQDSKPRARSTQETEPRTRSTRESERVATRESESRTRSTRESAASKEKERVSAPAAASRRSNPRRASSPRRSSVGDQFVPQDYVGKRVAKFFGDDLFFGTIQEFKAGKHPPGGKRKTPDFWFVKYDDGDCEDFSKQELLKYVALCEDNHHLDKAEKDAETEQEDSS